MLPGSRRTTDHPSFTTILCLSELPTVSSPSSIILGPVFSSAASISHSSHWNQTWHSIFVEMNSILKLNSWSGQPRHPLTPISSALPEATWHSANPHWSCNSLTHYCASVHSCAPKIIHQMEVFNLIPAHCQCTLRSINCSPMWNLFSTCMGRIIGVMATSSHLR